MRTQKGFYPSVFSSGLHRLQYRRSEEHTSELQSQSNLVCRLLLEKKKNLPCLRSTHMSSATTRQPAIHNHASCAFASDQLLRLGLQITHSRYYNTSAAVR